MCIRNIDEVFGQCIVSERSVNHCFEEFKLFIYYIYINLVLQWSNKCMKPIGSYFN